MALSPQRRCTQQSANMPRDKSTSLKLEFIIAISINYASMCMTCRRRRCGADNDACSRVWAVSGGSDTMGLSYGTIGIVVSLGSGGHGEGGSRNVGDAAAIWVVNSATVGVSDC